jgi:phosphomannomutase
MIKFGTGGWRDIIGNGFVERNVRIVAEGLFILMQNMKRETHPVIIGYDNRFLSKEAAVWMTEVLTYHNIKVEFINKPVPTPLIMYMVMDKGYDWGIAITASHNPAEYNGVKLFVREGRDAPVDTTQKLESYMKVLNPDVEHLTFEQACEKSLVKIINDPFDDFIDNILARLDIEAIKTRHLKVLVDPMHGSGFYPLNVVLNTTRCYTEFIHANKDAYFGNKPPAPTEETLQELVTAVKYGDYDLGIALDGDGDRLGIVDSDGTYISANQILVLLYWYLHTYKGWSGPVIRNLATTHMLDAMAKDMGEQCIEVPVGFKYISSGIDQYNAVLGGESSGGLTVRGHIHGKDSIYAASLFVEMLAVTGKTAHELFENLKSRYGSYEMVECNLTFNSEEKDKYQKAIFKEHKLPEFYNDIVRVSYEDGCKVYFDDDSWVICRFSGTESLLRIFAEASSKETAQRYIDAFNEFFKNV